MLSLGLLESFIAFPAYRVDLLSDPDNGAALGVDILYAPVLAGPAPSLDGCRNVFALALIAVFALDGHLHCVLRLAVKVSLPDCAASQVAVSSIRGVMVQP